MRQLLKPPKLRKSQRGANLVLFCGLAAMIIGFMGICIYTGLQAFIESDLQRVSMNAAMVGAARYYGDTANNRPTPDPATAKSIAQSAFNGMVDASSLNGFNATIKSVSNNDNNDSITIVSKASLGTAFLAPVGIKTIEVNATATARAVKYEPTLFTGPIRLVPVSTVPGSYSKTINLTFPLVDNKGYDLYVEEDPASFQQGYVVEACNDTTCYDLTEAATPIGTSKIQAGTNGVKLIYGNAIFNLRVANVNKATKIRITHGNDFAGGYFVSGVATPYDAATPLPLTISRVMIFGHSSACVAPDNCPIPAGFEPVE